MTQVLVTRPSEASQQLAGQLESLGMPAIVMPLYTFIAREPSIEMTQAWPTPGVRKLAVFTSPRAVQFGLAHLPEDVVSELEFVVIGSATRAMLESAGYPVHLQPPTGFTSEDLLLMPELALELGDAVIFCAPGGRETIANGMLELGWNVARAMVYERKTLLPTREQAEAISAANKLISTWTSVSALEIARQHLPEAAWEKILCKPALVISKRIQQHLQQLGGRHVELADGPGNLALLDSVQKLASRVNSD